MSWGALHRAFPLTEGERGNLYLRLQKDPQFRTLISGVLFQPNRASKTEFGVACWLFALHSRMRRPDRL